VMLFVTVKQLSGPSGTPYLVTTMQHGPSVAFDVIVVLQTLLGDAVLVGHHASTTNCAINSDSFFRYTGALSFGIKDGKILMNSSNRCLSYTRGLPLELQHCVIWVSWVRIILQSVV
jgi:hypothetical protein